MRRVLLVTLLVCPALAAAAPQARAAYYVGHSHGTRLVFRVHGHEVTWANATGRLYCTNAKGDVHELRHYRHNFADRKFPLRLDGRNRFKSIYPVDVFEEGYDVDEEIFGHAGERFVHGTFSYAFHYSTSDRGDSCHTGGHFGIPRRPVAFKAERRPEPKRGGSG